LKLHHNIVVEVTDKGEVLRVLHDPDRRLTYGLTEATELSDGRIALGSYIGDHLSFATIPRK